MASLPQSSSPHPPTTSPNAISRSRLQEADSFPFPPTYSFPPFYTLQPTLLTRTSQLAKWSLLIQRYHAHHHRYRLHIPTALSSPLFHNAAIHKRLSLASVIEIVNYMVKAEKDGGGGQRAEWIATAAGKGSEKTEAWVWWKKPDEWADVIAAWVDRTGQKGVVLTFWELLNGDVVKREEWLGMENEVLTRCLAGLVKRGKAQVFGEEGEKGVKFF
ncbi:MAG: hypothetical protein LQ349_001464 [Xanthoria aureola]|nr:MAG: hypothetical protein LQ349_001464 [Xanthoria aureola]